MPSHTVPDGLSAADLEAKWKSPEWEKASGFRWDARGVPLNLRLRRALSWLDRAERETEDADAAFIFYWIAFNAVYAVPRYGVDDKEQDAFEDYFAKIAPLDNGGIVYNAIWMKFNGPIKALLKNNFVFQPFWDDAPNWRQRFYDSQKEIEQELLSRNTRAILMRMFDRLYVLRNQLLHGGATWQGSVNREQVEDGAAIMAFLVPHFINLMLDNTAENWGQPRYSPEWAWRRLGLE